MIQLSANLCDPLLQLIRAGEAPIDAVEVGPWFRLRKIVEYRKMLPQMPFYFHGANLISRVGIIPGALAEIAAYVKQTVSPWVSMHMTFWLPGMVYLMHRFHVQMPPPDPARAAQRFIAQVDRLAHALPVPVLLENNEPIPFRGGLLEVQPQYISEMLAKTGCEVLLDLAHARVSAAAMQVNIEDYLACFPLERVRQIHVSGPRLRNGRLFDAHEPLEQADYDLLEFLLERAHPQIVTLEYIRDAAAMRDQFQLLRGLLASR